MEMGTSQEADHEVYQQTEKNLIPHHKSEIENNPQSFKPLTESSIHCYFNNTYYVHILTLK